MRFSVVVLVLFASQTCVMEADAGSFLDFLRGKSRRCRQVSRTPLVPIVDPSGPVAPIAQPAPAPIDSGPPAPAVQSSTPERTTSKVPTTQLPFQLLPMKNKPQTSIDKLPMKNKPQTSIDQDFDLIGPIGTVGPIRPSFLLIH